MKLKNVVASLAVGVLAFSPMHVYADDTVYATDANGTNYTSIEDAWNAACSGVEITMQQDWMTSDRLIVGDSQNVTIEMNGHKIDRNLWVDYVSDGEVIYLSENSTLTLNGNKAPNTQFTFWGADNEEEGIQITTTNGGIITGGQSTNGAGGVHMKANSTLNINNVGIVGNTAGSASEHEEGGGVNMNNDNCTIHMTNNAQISHNCAKNGAGVYVDGQNCVIEMNNSKMYNNYAYGNGGAIYSNRDATYVNMSNGSKITTNSSRGLGGAIYFDNDYCQIKSVDTTSSISNNYAYNDGGAIYMASSGEGDNRVIQNVTFESNQAEKGKGGAIYCNLDNFNIDGCIFKSNTTQNGGALYLDGDNITVSNCKITENRADNEGGGIYNNNANTISNCTITNNSCGNEGGGIYEVEDEDITLSGKCTINNNKRGDKKKLDQGSNDDLFLENTWLHTAYIKGEVSTDSNVGIRTASDDEVQIGTDISSDCSSAFFLNDSGEYHVSYESSKLYKRTGLTGSIFGNGNVMMIGGICAVIIVAGVVAIIIKKKKSVNN